VNFAITVESDTIGNGIDCRIHQQTAIIDRPFLRKYITTLSIRMMQLQLLLSLLLLPILLLDHQNIFVAATTPQLSSSVLSTYRNSITTEEPSDYALVFSHSSKSTFWIAQILRELRGGGEGYYDEDEEYDEYDSEEDDPEEETPIRREERYRKTGSRQSAARDSRRGGNKNASLTSKSLSSASKTASAATKLATKSLSMTGSLAWNALVKQPGKLAFHVIRPKHVELVETFGLWRLDQQIIEKSTKRGEDPRTIGSVATIEFVPPPQPPRRQRGRPRRVPPPLVVVRHSKDKSKDDKDEDDKHENVYRAPYTFVRKNKYLKGASLSSFQTTFVAPAFLIGENQTRFYGYKGSWQRKLADKSVIKLKGKIYQVHKQKFGKKRGEYVYGPAVGTFVMRRRVSMSEEEYEDFDESDEDDFDDELEYDDEKDEYSDYE